MLRILQNTLQRQLLFCITEFSLFCITEFSLLFHNFFFFLKVNFEKALILCSVPQVCLKSPLSHFLSAVNNFRTDLQEISLILVGLAASQFLSENLDEKPIQTRQAKVLSHNYNASQQQHTLVTTESTFFRIDFYGSRSLAENKP